MAGSFRHGVASGDPTERAVVIWTRVDDEVRGCERAMLATLDHLLWCDMASHGYVVYDLDPRRLRAEWWHVDGVLERLPGERLGASAELSRDASTFERITTPESI